MNDTRARMHPPTVLVGRGGPPATVLAEDLRAKRQKISDEVTKLRALRRSSSADERESYDQAISECISEVRDLSDQIAKKEDRT